MKIVCEKRGIRQDRSKKCRVQVFFTLALGLLVSSLFFCNQGFIFAEEQVVSRCHQICNVPIIFPDQASQSFDNDARTDLFKSHEICFQNCLREEAALTAAPLQAVIPPPRPSPNSSFSDLATMTQQDCQARNLTWQQATSAGRSPRSGQCLQQCAQPDTHDFSPETMSCIQRNTASVTAPAPVPRPSDLGKKDESTGAGQAENPSETLGDQASENRPEPTTEGADENSIELTESQARAESQKYRQACLNAHQEANVCCNDPMQCIFGVSFGSQAEMNLLLNTMVGVGGAALSARAGGENDEGLNKACSMMRAGGLTVAGLNLAGGTQCRSSQSTCNKTCKSHAESLYHRGRQCGFDLETGARISEGPACSTGTLNMMLTDYNLMKSRVKSCQNLNLQILQSGMSAIQSTQAAMISDLCAKKSETLDPSGTGLERRNSIGTIGTTDCANPENRNSPICSCSNPAFSHLPHCRGLVQNPNFNQRANGTQVASAGVGFGGRGGSNTGELPINAQQLPPTQNIEPTEQRAQAIQPDMMGAGMMGASGGGLGPAGAGPAPQGEAGFDTDVLSKNAVGGGGYSVSPGPGFSSNAGFSGYGSGADFSRNRIGIKKPNLNLKDFLPGGKKDPNRQIAGLEGDRESTALAKKGNAHDDLFSMVLIRFRIHCKLKGMLEECYKLKTNY